MTMSRFHPTDADRAAWAATGGMRDAAIDIIDQRNREILDLQARLARSEGAAQAERAQTVAFIRIEADRYKRDAAAVRPLIDSATTNATRRLLEFEHASAVSKGSMARVLAAYIERGDHLFGQPVMMPEEATP